jgi:hypothetical protein
VSTRHIAYRYRRQSTHHIAYRYRCQSLRGVPRTGTDVSVYTYRVPVQMSASTRIAYRYRWQCLQVSRTAQMSVSTHHIACRYRCQYLHIMPHTGTSVTVYTSYLMPAQLSLSTHPFDITILSENHLIWQRRIRTGFTILICRSVRKIRYVIIYSTQ